MAGVLSVLSPFLGMVTCSVIVAESQARAPASDWFPGFDSGGATFLFLCGVGLVLGIVSLRRKENPRAVGFAGLLLNLVPLAFVAMFLVMQGAS